MAKEKLNSLLNFIAEAGMLKMIPRSGWSVLGIKNAESVADHSFRCAVISYLIAHMEKVEPYHAVLMALFNDIHEARIGDLHKMAQAYVPNYASIEEEAQGKQIAFLPEKIEKELQFLRKGYKDQKTKASLIARDADILECLIQAKEYAERGVKEARKFMKKAPECLKTKSAKALWKAAKDSHLTGWWEKLAVFER